MLSVVGGPGRGVRMNQTDVDAPGQDHVVRPMHSHPSRLTQGHGGPVHRYSAKKMKKPINFFCQAPAAGWVAVAGDFNDWSPEAHPMRQGPDGAWHLQIPLHHGHHRYVFVIDGKPTLDPRAQGVARNEHNERVSLMSVS